MKKLLYLLPFACMSLLFSCGGEEKKEEETSTNDSTATATDTVASADTLQIKGHLDFPSADGVSIVADCYEIIPGEKYVLLCHQAGFSRGEYIETAKKLNELGYNCLAIDQRSGKECNGVVNQTALNAQAAKKGDKYADAEQDIVAAIDYIYEKSGHKVIVLGSSYSAALALKIGKTNDKVEALALFSPGEYLEGVSLKKEIAGLSVPVFATSSKKEAKDVATLLTGIKSTIKDVFVPSAEGDHGSKVLWPDSPAKDEYWNALTAFLKKLTQPA